MSRTMTINKGGGGTNYEPGWKELTISRGAYGVYNDMQYLDVWFEDYPENLNARIYAKKGTNGEEFAIGQVFRFADAGITGALDGADGKMIIKMDDNPSLLAGKQVNAYFYKDGKYSRILKQFAPAVFQNAAEEFKEKDVEYWKGKAENYYTKYVLPKIETDTEETNVSSTITDQTMNHSTVNTEEVPF